MLSSASVGWTLRRDRALQEAAEDWNAQGRELGIQMVRLDGAEWVHRNLNICTFEDQTSS